MRILMFGAGCARDHATFLRLRAEGNDVCFALVGANAFLAREHGVRRVANCAEALELAQGLDVELAVVLGPDLLMAGAADAFRTVGIPCFGPSAIMASVEASKVLGKRLMVDAGIATPEFHVFEDADETCAFLDRNWRDGMRWVVKAEDFLVNAAWRTVVPATVGEAHKAACYLLRDAPAIDRTRRVMLERFVVGEELSLHVLCDGRDYRIMPAVCDYKRRNPGDTGPNTHGMGAVASTMNGAATLLDGLDDAIVAPALDGFRQMGCPFTGVLYVGLVRAGEGFQALEFNVRPGNPEWLALMGLLRSPLGEAIAAAASGELGKVRLDWHSSLVSMALFKVASEYPFARPKHRTHLNIEPFPDGDIFLVGEDVYEGQDGTLCAGGGRVAAAMAVGRDISEARGRCLKVLHGVSFEGGDLRPDIGETGLPRSFGDSRAATSIHDRMAKGVS